MKCECKTFTLKSTGDYEANMQVDNDGLVMVDVEVGYLSDDMQSQNSWEEVVFMFNFKYCPCCGKRKRDPNE